MMLRTHATHCRARTPRVLVLLALVGSCVALGACSGGGQTPLDVQVLDPLAHRPVPGALVRCVPQNPKHPLRVAEAIFRSPTAPGSAVTDASGRVTVSAPSDRPFDLVIVPPGGAPDSIAFDDLGAFDRGPRTYAFPPDPSGRALVMARIGQGGTGTPAPQSRE